MPASDVHQGASRSTRVCFSLAQELGTWGPRAWPWFSKKTSKVGGRSGVETFRETEAGRALGPSHPVGKGPVLDALTPQKTKANGAPDHLARGTG